jgi:hypothetical protein
MVLTTARCPLNIRASRETEMNASWGAESSPLGYRTRPSAVTPADGHALKEDPNGDV